MCYSSINEEQLYCDTGINAKLRKLKKNVKNKHLFISPKLRRYTFSCIKYLYK